MMCDMIVAASDSKFVYPEAKVGAFVGLMGGFPARMPVKVGMQWTMTGEPMTAQRAYEIGFVNEVCEPGEQLERALKIAHSIAANAPLIVQALKALARETLPQGPVEKAYAHSTMIQKIRKSEDWIEGLAAMREKRKPVFKGR
jgi:enoyl-CoA hydratase